MTTKRKPKRQTRGAGAVRQLPSGRYQAKVKVDGAYHPAPHTFDTKLAAQTWLTNQHRAIAAGTWTPPEREPSDPGRAPRFADFAETWLTQRDLKPRTREHYRKLLDQRLLPHWGGRRLTTITPGEVEAWYATLDPSTPTMRAHTYALLRTIMHAAWRRDLIAANPCRVEGGGSVKRTSRTSLPTAVQVHDLADAMPDKYRVMTLLAAWCGLRFGELTALEASDIVTDDDGNPIVVTVSKAVVRVDGEYVVGSPKSDAGVRDVVIPPHIRDDVRRWVEQSDGPLLFPGKHGQYLASSSLYWHFGQARTALGLPGLRWHDLRHFAGTTAAQTGATLAEVMGRLGHSTTTAAMRYQHIASNRDAEIAEQLSNVIPLKRHA